MNTTSEPRNRLEAWLERVRGYQENPPPTESTMCYRVVDPLLEALGYERDEIEPQVGDVARQYPDYTILPGTEHTWFVEAKKWSERLDDSHVAQALTYANNSGKRFVVLTNGREWRLYDNALPGDLTRKLVVTTSIDEPAAIIPLLEAMSKDSVVTGGLQSYATKHRLRERLSQALRDPKRSLVKVIARTLARSYSDLQRVGIHELTKYLAELFDAREHPREHQRVTSISAVQEVQSIEGGGQEVSATLLDLAEGRVTATGTKPRMLITPDAKRYDTNAWCDAARIVVEWLDQKGDVPIPFKGRTRGDAWFLNSAPVHESGKPMKRFESMHLRGGVAYIDTNRSAKDFATCLCQLCRATGIAPSEFQLELRRSRR